MTPTNPDGPGAGTADPKDERKKDGLPPGSDTKGDEHSRLRGNDREAAPYDDAPAEGHLNPAADDPAS